MRAELPVALLQFVLSEALCTSRGVMGGAPGLSEGSAAGEHWQRVKGRTATAAASCVAIREGTTGRSRLGFGIKSQLPQTFVTSGGSWTSFSSHLLFPRNASTKSHMQKCSGEPSSLSCLRLRPARSAVASRNKGKAPTACLLAAFAASTEAFAASRKSATCMTRLARFEITSRSKVEV